MIKLITNEVLSEYTGKKVYWHEMKTPMIIRVHFDQERYLSDYKDIYLSNINEYIDEKNICKKINNNSFRCAFINLYKAWKNFKNEVLYE